MIGDKIRQFGESHFNTLREFAKSMEMSPPSLQQYLNGDRKPGFPVIKRLYDLGCDINWLLREESEIMNVVTDQNSIYEPPEVARLKKELSDLKNKLNEYDSLINRLKNLQEQ